MAQAQVIQKAHPLQIGDVKAIVRHSVALADARARRNKAAAKLITSLPRELGRLNETMKTLLQARSDEFFEVYAERERILSAWRNANQETIKELSDAMKDYFKEAEAIADLASRPSIATVLSTLEAEASE
jgi:flagellar motility protein MotE (MotC chaperone)